VTHLVLRLLIVPVGIGLAALAALVVGVTGAIAWGHGASFAALAAATGLSVVLAAMTGADPDLIGDFLSVVSLVALGILIVPIAVVALAGEIFGMVSWIAYAFAMGAAYAAVPILFPGDPATHGWPDGSTLGFFATGLSAGTVYWAIAGRSTRRRQRQDAPLAGER
jgi:hypothetical protein